MRRLVTLAALALAGASGSASAADGVASATSSNWAGYAVNAVDGQPFTSVSASWVQPRATCAPGSPSYAAFWVGLGGFADESEALEQIGTEADCAEGGSPRYRLWYELVPARPVTIKLKVLPGNRVSASVGVDGQSVVLRIRNQTRRTSFTRTFTPAVLDASSAEWIAEAPSACGPYGGCRTLPLANFGSIAFSSAATTAGGHTGTISDPSWSPTAVELDATGHRWYPFGLKADTDSTGAVPTDLSADGTGFSIGWQGAGQPAPTGQAPADPYAT